MLESMIFGLKDILPMFQPEQLGMAKLLQLWRETLSLALEVRSSIL